MYRVNYFFVVLDGGRAITFVLANTPSSNRSFVVMSTIYEDLLFKGMARDSWYDVKLSVLDFAPDVFIDFR